jgi:hypothetical protein
LIMAKENKIGWLKDFSEDDYREGISYLNLIYRKKICDVFIDKMKRTKTSAFRAKDILRASGLPLLSKDDPDVQKNLRKIDAGKKLSPILLLRDRDNGKVVIVDGYHRVCAIYSRDRDERIPCKII